jgi:hypothetical protein
VRDIVEFVKKGLLAEHLRFFGYVLDAVSCVENVFDSLVGQRQVPGCNSISTLLV